MPRNEHLRQKRIEQNWRQQDLADQIGTTVLSIQRWERGTHQPSLYYRTKLCTLFALSPQELGLIEELSSSEEALPKGETGPASLTSPLRLWTIPYTRNPHFTGRTDLLTHLTQQFAPHEGEETSFIQQAAITQSQALHGLGGIGKTQLAIEYIYRSLEANRYTHTLWISAASEELILTSFAELSTLLPTIRQQGEHNERKLAKLVMHWLEMCEESWLMVFDNADDIEMASSYFPTRGNGDLLLTTRASAIGAFDASLEVETMGLLEGAQFLLRRAQRLDQASDDEINEASNIVSELGEFPLAIDQAGAYIEETGCSLQHYLSLYQQRSQELLARRGRHAPAYPNSVATTWSLSFQYLEQHHPAAAQCLQLTAFLAPDHIPEELLIDGASFWTPPLQQVVTDPLRFDEMLEALLAFSFIKRHSQERHLSIHRLVQVVQMEQISRVEQQRWAGSIVLAVEHLFPHVQEDDASSWPLCLRYLEQAQVCNTLIQQYQLVFSEAMDLLDRTGEYLYERALPTLAEPLLQRALHLREQHLGPDHLKVALSLYHQAAAFYRQGYYKQAESLQTRALHIQEQHLGQDHLEVATSLNFLAMIHLLQGSYEQAELLFQRALSIFEQRQGRENDNTNFVINNLAALYRAQGKYKQAEPLFRRALRYLEQHREPDHLEVAFVLNGLGLLYWYIGDYRQAEPLYTRALRIREQHLGQDHPLVAITLLNLAALFYDRGQEENTEQMCQRALRIYEQTGQEHSESGYALHWLALVAAKHEQYEEAEQLERKALHLWEKLLGSEHPNLAYPLHGLALLFAQQGQPKEAEVFFQQALRLREERLGPEHLETVAVIHDFAGFQYRQGKEPEAVLLYQRALAIRIMHVGVSHAWTIETQTNLHTVLTTLNRTEEIAALEKVVSPTADGKLSQRA